MGLAERAVSLRQLEELLSGDGPGVVKVVLVEGAAGFGKTSLLHGFLERATARGATCLSAAAARIERDMPLSTCTQLFRQLFHGSALSAAKVEQAEALLRDGARAAAVPGTEPEAPVRLPAPILNGLSAILLKVADGGPLVIGVDDIHHADQASVHFLAYLARQTRYPRVLLVLTECLRAPRLHSLLQTELLHRPGAARLRLQPLSEQGVAAMLGEHLGPVAAGRLAPGCHRVSGGNPLLVRALLDDYRMSGPAEPVGPVFGDAFRQAVLACLHSSESTMLARGLAVLPESASAILLGELVQLDAESTGLTRDVLRATGLVDACGLLEPVRAAVLSGMRPPERAVLRLRAAELLHVHGASPAVVADRLMAAEQALAPWAITVLREAAGHALAEGQVQKALGYLRLAYRKSADERSPVVHLDLARAEWLADPATAARHLPDLIRTLREGLLPASAAAGLAGWLLWFGRVDDALDIVAQDRGARSAASEPAAAPWWLRYAYPEFLQPPPGRLQAAEATVPMTPDRRGEVMLASALAPGDPVEMMTQAERILGEGGLASPRLAQVVAIAVLVYIDELDVAERWCDALGGSPAWRPPLIEALRTALQALICERRGEPEAAVKHVREAFDLIPPKGWGIFVGIPLATMMLALTAMRNHAEVARCLRLPVPYALFRSPLVLPYLQGRGRYSLAIGRPQAALEEFRACEKLMTAWGLDAPGFVPWRIEVAHARLALGDRQTARRLAAEQLEGLGPGLRRTRGMTLRALAAASDPEERIRLLDEAVKLLERSGDRLELARALADLGESHRAAGQAERAAELDQRARSIAAECGAAMPARGTGPVAADAWAEGGGAGSLTGLSEAERRVAALAAKGYTNRQIARRLHVTTSTVEQHLTRVYRKLNISRRADLPADELTVPETFN